MASVRCVAARGAANETFDTIPRRLLRLITYLAPSIPAALFRAVAEHLESTCGVAVALQFDERISGPLQGDSDPFADGTADVGFICAPSVRWMHSKDANEIELLPSLVPSDPRAEGRPVYFADVVVRADSRFQTFDDLRGARWAYNDRNSRSGWFSMVEHAGDPDAFFGSLVQSGSHLRSLAIVGGGEADAAAIDSNVRRPDGLRVVATWGPYPIQPVIVRGALDGAVKAQIARALLTMPRDVLAPFGFSGFAAVDERAYR
jgi:ABC-type phosphate/phosphonate transport system substrate-binding protein